jgi:hypothetical protein
MVPNDPLSPIFATTKPMQWPNGAIKAWRSWRLIEHILPDFTSVITLRSVTYTNEWLPRQEMIAECAPRALIGSPKFKTTTHAVPDLNHGCGIYSVKTEAQALEWRQHIASQPCVWGEVNIWGHVYKFTRGYLSEFAYPARIIVPKDLKDWNNRFTPEMIALELQETYVIEAVIE